MRHLKLTLLFFLTFSFLAGIVCETKIRDLDLKTALKLLSYKYNHSVALAIPTGAMKEDGFVEFEGSISNLDKALKNAEIKIRKTSSFRILEQLAEEGYIKFQYLGIKKEGAPQKDELGSYVNVFGRQNIELTEKANQYIVGESTELLYVGLMEKIGLVYEDLGEKEEALKIRYLKFGDIVVSEVTGIKPINDDTRIVEFNYKLDNFSSIGKIVSNIIDESDALGLIYFANPEDEKKDYSKCFSIDEYFDKYMLSNEVKFVLSDDGWRIDD